MCEYVRCIYRQCRPVAYTTRPRATLRGERRAAFSCVSSLFPDICTSKTHLLQGQAKVNAECDLVEPLRIPMCGRIVHFRFSGSCSPLFYTLICGLVQRLSRGARIFNVRPRDKAGPRVSQEAAHRVDAKQSVFALVEFVMVQAHKLAGRDQGSSIRHGITSINGCDD